MKPFDTSVDKGPVWWKAPLLVEVEALVTEQVEPSELGRASAVPHGVARGRRRGVSRSGVESVSVPNRCATNLGSTSAGDSRERITPGDGNHFGGATNRRAHETRVVVFEKQRGRLQTSARRVSRSLERVLRSSLVHRGLARVKRAQRASARTRKRFAHQGERGARFRAAAQVYLGCSRSQVASSPGRVRQKAVRGVYRASS